MQKLTVCGDINSFTGYGLHSIQIVRDLERLSGAFITVRPLSSSELFGARIPVDVASKFVQQPQPEGWELLLHPPNFLPTPGKKTAYFSMWEATKLPPMGVTFLNKADVVIVPCSWNASCFSACGVTAPIRVVPLGINTDVFTYKPALPDTKICVFGAAGRLAHGGVRKGLNDVIDAFQKAFPRELDVELHLKCFPDCNIKQVADPRIKVTAAYLSEAQMAAWYRNLHCFVSAAKAEGWGLMQHQAMATGVPVISVDFGGITEFFNASNGYPVDYTLSPATQAYTGCGHWALPNEQSMIDAMRRVYTQRYEAFEKGALAAQSVEHLSWDNSNRQLLSVLKEFGAL